MSSAPLLVFQQILHALQNQKEISPALLTQAVSLHAQLQLAHAKAVQTVHAISRDLEAERHAVGKLSATLAEIVMAFEEQDMQLLTQTIMGYANQGRVVCAPSAAIH